MLLATGEAGRLTAAAGVVELLDGGDGFCASAVRDQRRCGTDADESRIRERPPGGVIFYATARLVLRLAG